MLVAAGGAREVAQACALLSERHLLPPRTASTTSDLLSALDDWQRDAAARRSSVARRTASRSAGPASRRRPSTARCRDDAFLPRDPRRLSRSRRAAPRARLAERPAGLRHRRDDRAARAACATASSSSRSTSRQSASGIGSPAESQSRDRASVRDREPSSSAMARRRRRLSVVHRFDADSGRVRAVAVDRYDALVLAERPVAGRSGDRARGCSPRRGSRAVRARTIAAAAASAVRRTRRRRRRRWFEPPRYGARALDDDRSRARACAGRRCATLDRDAPETLAVPSGRRHRARVQRRRQRVRSVKLQELFGLAETPRIGRRREPVVLRCSRRTAAGAGDARPAQLLGSHLPGGAKGTARPLSEASVAGRSVDGAADGAHDAQG